MRFSRAMFFTECCAGHGDVSGIAVVGMPDILSKPFAKQATPEELPRRTHLSLTFQQHESSSEVELVFDKRPLGIDFCKGLPVSVKAVFSGSRAEEQGVAEG